MKTLHTIYTNFAKRLALVLTLILTFSVGQIWSADYNDVGTSLTNGKSYILVAGGSYAITASTPSSGWIGKTDVSNLITNQTLKTELTDIVWIATDEGDGKWSFKNGNNYITNNSGSTYRNMACSSTKSVFTIKNDKIYSTGSTGKWLQGLSSGFRMYNTSQSGAKETFVFYELTESCANSVTVSAGSQTNVNSISFSSGSIATCSSTETDRQVTITVTPNTGYEMTSSARLTFTKTSGTATATYVSGPTASGSSYQFVYQFNQNDNGEGTFSATCTAKTSTVSFNQNGGEGGQTTSVTATYGQNMPTPITLPTRYGHTFGGYYDGEGGTGTQYYTAEGESAKTWNKTSSTAKLYAKWTEKPLTNYRTSCTTETVVTLNPNGGTFATEPDGWDKDGNNNYVIRHTGTEITLPTNISQEGKIFRGWYKEETKYETIPADLTESITLTAKWSDKQDPEIAWNPTSCNVTIDAGGQLPIFQNPNNLTPITFVSSNSEVASVDNNGVITLGTTATTATVTITATFDGNDTYAAKNVTCTLTVHPSNCRWVEVTDNTTLEDGDKVVITMEYNGHLYALPNDGGNNTPELVSVTTADILGGNVQNKLKWVIEKEVNNLIFHPRNSSDNLFFNSADDGVRIGSTQLNANVNHKFVIDNNHLANIGTNRYLGIGTVSGIQKWKTYTTSNGNLTSQTLKFYKRECLDASKVWVEGNLTNVTCTPQLPQQLAKDGSITLTFSPVTAEYTLPTNVSVKMGSTNLTPLWNRTTGELTINAPTGGFTDNVLVTVEAVELHTITWMVGNNSVLTEKVANATGVTKIPTDTPSDYAIGNCANAFMGWTETPLGSTEGQPAPADLCTAAQMKAKHTSVTGKKTFYAVFATKEGGGGAEIGTVVFSEDFSSFTSGNKMTGTQSSGTGRSIYGSVSVTYSYLNGTGADTKIYGENTAGGTSPELLVGKKSSTFTISGIPSAGAAKLQLSYKQNAQSLTSNVSGTGYSGGTNSSTKQTTTTIITVGSEPTFNLTFTGPSGDKNVRLDDISIIVYETSISYSNYVTNCCNTPAPTNGNCTSVSGTEIKLTWDDAANTNRYHITGGNLSAEGVYVTNKYYNITGLTECEEYTFNVSAYPEDGCESEAITITAQPFSGAKTVTFNYNGNGQANTTTSTSCNNKSITLPTPAWTGYRFMGWFTAESGGTEIDDNPYTPTEDITLFAHWEKEYTVTYDLQGGTASPVCSDDKYIAGEIVIICTSTPVKSGYRFTGWTYAPDVTITNGQFTMPESNVTITAEFVARAVTNIEVATNTHRVLMQGTAFIGEQIRVTYDNGETELLEWSNSKLTFTGHNTNELGVQTVTVTYTGEGTAHTQYNIEVIDGLGITFWDGDYTETIKYEPGDLVDVDSRIGQNICSGWEFAGWSETKVANESEEYVPVHNFNATDAKVLYAVYVKKKAQWTTIVTADEAKSGAKYVLAYDRYDTYYALTSSVKDVNYLAGKVVTSTEGELNSFDVYYLSAEPTADLIWELVSTGENGKWYLYNKNTAKYIDLSTQGQIHLTDLPSDKLQMESGYNDSQIRIASSTVPTYYLSWDNSNTRYNTYASSNSQEYWYTKDEEFTSTPPCSPLSATFHGNGGIVTDGVNSGDDLTITEPTRDAGITTPTASFADCNGKSWTFVGWSREEIDVTRVPVLTTDLLHDGGGNKHYKIQEDGEEFWAVFTNTGDPETKYGTITFTQDDWGPSYTDGTKTKTVNSIDYTFDYKRLSSASTQGIQFEESTGKFANATSLGKINSISFVNFNRGDINDLKVYVGKTADNVTTVLTAADLQIVGNTCTYYPSAVYAYFKVVSVGEVCYVEEIIINYGQGTQVWATTPDCSIIRILTDEEVYVTATKDRGVMATASLTIKTWQLDPNADVIITSTSNDVYFSASREANFAKAVANQPKNSLTLNADEEGNLQQDIYVHYKPSVVGDGTPASVVVSANLATPNPSVTDDQTIYVRNLPAKFVIATKVGANWYALPANMSSATNPEGVLIEVDETTMIATAPSTTSYTLFPVKTTNGEYDRYATNTAYYEGNAYGDRVRFVAALDNKGLWANNNENGNTIRNYAAISSISDGGTTSNTNPSYEWKITTTVVDGNWQYTLQTDQEKNQKYLRYWTGATGSPKWGTYAAGNDQLYFLPVTEIQPFEYAVVEWYPTKMLIQTDAAISNPTAKISDAIINNVTCTNKGGKLYEIAGLPLASNPTKVLTIKFSDAGENNYTNATAIPVIISGSETTMSSAPFTTLIKDVYNYSDLVVRDGATLTIDGGTNAENTFFNVTIYPTSKISVPEGKKLTVHSLTFFGGIDEIYDGSTYNINKYGVPQLSLKGTLNKTVTNIDYIMRVNLDQMYQVGVPYDVNLSDITYWDGTAMELGDNLYVSAYDGQKRANLEPTGSWVWEVNFAEKVLKAGIGYTISADMQSGVGNEYSIIRLPMKSNVTSGNTEAAKTVQVYAYANTNGVEITDNNKGWNYLSNPYMAAISGAEADSKLVVGYLDRNEVTEPWKWVDDTYRYVTIPSDDGTYHYQQKFKDAILNPFKSFFLQIAAEGELSFDLASRQSAPARYLQTNNEKREVEFEVVLANDTRSDNLGFLIGEDYTPAYEINADLEKMIGSMSVYTIYNGYNLAYNALSPTNAAEQIPIGYVVPTVGEYTFALDESSDIEDVEHIYLIDYETSAITDLVTDVYTFTASEQKSDTRFAINVTLKSKESTVTGLVNINKDSEQSLKFIHNDKIYILHNGVIYDATGKFVETINK